MFENIKNTKIASFRLGGEKIELNLSEMTRSAGSYTKMVGDLQVIVDFRTVADNMYRWVVRLINKGDEKTPRITEFYGMDLDFPAPGEAKWESIYGDTCNGEAFMPVAQLLTEETPVKLEAESGRSSQGHKFPYFDLTSDAGSTIFAIGWTGQWMYNLTKSGDTAALVAGFTDCDMYLNPGESIRSIGALIYSDADVLTTRQNFRRLFREKLSPARHSGGKLEVPLSLQVFDRYFWTTPEWATEKGQIHCINCADKCGYFNTYWLDAAWFRDGFPTGVGNYEFSPGYPNGLAPVSKLVHEKGMKFMLWFEPERVEYRSDTARDHREYMLDIEYPNWTNYLFDLSNDEAADWLIATIKRMIRDNGVDIYRQDFNNNTLPYWRKYETEGRKGYMENKYVTNLYRFWDELLAEFPGLLIDNCASGGRRLDWEMNTRSFPMWRSDTGSTPPTEEEHTYVWHQNQTMGLTRYLPYHSTSTWFTDANIFRSSATMGLACNLDLMNDSFDAEDAKKPLAEFVTLVDYWDGDFYPLTEATVDESVWFAYQLALADSGFCAFFRRADNTEPQKTFTLNAIDPGKIYEVTLSDNNYVKTTDLVKGAELMNYTVSIPGGNETLILTYKAL